MAKKLGSDGRPVDVPTQPVGNDAPRHPGKGDGRSKGAGASPPTESPPSGTSRSGGPASRTSPPGSPPTRTTTPGPGGGIDLGDAPTVALRPGRERGTGGGSGETTRPLGFPPDPDSPPDEPGGGGSPPGRPYPPGEEGHTKVWHDGTHAPGSKAGSGGEEETVVWGGGPRRGDGVGAPPAPPGGTGPRRTSRAHAVNPVTGWLVVVDGPGKGSAVQLGFGHNTIGRSSAMRVRLDFGDRKISRDTHATITYDPKGNVFHLQQGTNLTYVQDELVLNPVRLEAGALIGIGNTLLRFVPFCDDAFTWEWE